MLEKIPPFWGFENFTPTIPKLYWNVKSQEQRILNLFDLLDKLVNYANQIGESVNYTKEEIEQLRKDFNNLFVEGSEFWNLFEKKLNKWVDDNVKSLIQKSMKNVYFGLTKNGYFCAYIPESWSDITFDTGATYGLNTYGRLLLRYNVDGATGVIDNTGYGITDDAYKELVNELKKVEKSLNEVESVANDASTKVESVSGKVDINTDLISQTNATVTTLENTVNTKLTDIEVKVATNTTTLTTPFTSESEV